MNNGKDNKETAIAELIESANESALSERETAESQPASEDK